MAIRKPVVLNNGQFEQLQAGDSIQNVEQVQLTNNNAGVLVIGTPVYAVANDAVDKAMANAVGTINVIGLIADVSVAASTAGSVQHDGILVATTTQWDAVTGLTGGLVKDNIYYIDAATAGKLTSTAPTTAGQFVKEIGTAISTTEMQIGIRIRIKL